MAHERTAITPGSSAGRGSIAGLLGSIAGVLVLKWNPEMTEIAIAVTTVVVGLLNGLGNAARNAAKEDGLIGIFGKLFSWIG